MIPQAIQEAYNLKDYVEADQYVYVLIKGALYGLKENGRIANEDIVDHLALHGYRESQLTPGLFFHETHDIHLPSLWMTLVLNTSTKHI